MERTQKLFDANALIAEYAGATYSGSYNNKEVGTTKLYNYAKGAIVPKDYCTTHSTGSMEYISSWDWLMPVLRKLINEEGDAEYLYLLDYTLDIKQLFWAIVTELENLNYER